MTIDIDAATPTEPVTTVDPFTSEIIRHKLFRVMEEGLITLGRVSGTTVTAEGHDVLVALYRPDGTIIQAGLGFLHHIMPAARAVKEMVRRFGDDPGIYEGDVFLANDPFTVAMHCPDVFMITPIHWNGEIASWVVNYVHVTDIGGVDVGGFCPNATECYHEGFSTPGLKLVEKGKIRRDIYDTFLNMIRDPGMTGLDLKSQVSANNVVRDRMQAMYESYGVPTVDAVARQLIDESESRLRTRLGELPDGVWHARRHLDIRDERYLLDLVMRKEGESLVYDFSGSSPLSAAPINCQYWATVGAALSAVFPLLAWDMTWNEGIVRCIEVIAPEGSLLNATKPAPISLNTTATVAPINILSNAVLSKMLAASPKYSDRAVGCWGSSFVVGVTGGVNRDGDYVAQLGADCFGMPEGARPFMDGASSGGHITNVAQKMANVESEEQAFPKLFHYRRILADSGGAGKFRGGAAHEYAITPHRILGDEMMAVVSPGIGENFPGTSGIAGGDPGGTTAHRVFREVRFDTLVDAPEPDASAVEYVGASSVGVSSKDIVYLRGDGGGGYGDPLDRDPSLVHADVASGIVSIAAAKSEYGVALDPTTDSVDEPATRSQRLALREERLGRKPTAEPRDDIARTPFRINEYLQLTSDRGHVECVACGHQLCDSAHHWKDHAVTRERPVRVIGPPLRESDEFVLRDFFCPGCARSLEVEVTRPHDKPMYDVVTSWPGQD